MKSNSNEEHTTIVHNYFETRIIISPTGHAMQSQTVLKDVLVEAPSDRTPPKDIGNKKGRGKISRPGSQVTVSLGHAKIGQDRKSAPSSDSSQLDRVLSCIGRKTLKQIVDAEKETVERACIEASLEMSQGNKALAAKLLGLSRQSFYAKLSKLRIHE